MSSPTTSSRVVLDASAVLTLLFKEPGAETVQKHLQAGVIGAANLAEVLAKLSDHGLPAPEAARAVAILGLEVAPMTEAQAQRSGGCGLSPERPGCPSATVPALPLQRNSARRH